MEETAQQEQDPTASTGERPAESANLREQPNLLEDEKPPRLFGDQPISSDATGDFNAGYPLHANASFDQPFLVYFPGYDDSTSYWYGFPCYVNAASMLVLPPLAYGQYTVVATPLPSLMVDWKLYSLHQNPFYQPYYPQPVPDVPNISSTALVPQMELMVPESNAQESSSGNRRFSQESTHFIQFGSFGRGELSQSSSNRLGSSNFQGQVGPANSFPNQSNLQEADVSLSSMTTQAAHHQTAGIIGSYDHYVKQRAVRGVGLVPSSSNIYYSDGGSYGISNMGRTSTSLLGANDQNRITLGKGKVQDRDRSSGVISTDLHNFFSGCGRGPRTSKPKDQNTSGQGASSSSNRIDTSNSVVHFESYNQPDFATNYENVMFFIIKSFSEDNVYRSIKYSFWASTVHGNRKLDAAYQKAKEMEANCPIFLFFWVNSGSQFCGVAEMVGPVNFEKDAEYWDRDRWSGLFPVKWLIIKDIPNSLLRHILIEYNENRPVTNSRDMQQVNLEQGIQMLKIFQSYVARTSILQDFDFYEQRERDSMENKARRRASSTRSPVPESSVNQVSNSFSQALQLEESDQEVRATESGGNSRTGSRVHCTVEGGRVLEPERGCSSTTDALGSPADDHEPNV